MTDTSAATTATDSITIVLADDHTVVRNGLRMLLEAESDIEVVAEAGDVDEAKRFTLGYKPTVLVLDLNMPGGSSLEAIPKVAETSPDTSVVVLTMQDDPAFAREALPGRRPRLRAEARGRYRTCAGDTGCRRRRNVAEPGPRRPHGRHAGRAGRRARGTERP